MFKKAQERSISLIILGIVAIIAVIALVMLFKSGTTGAIAKQAIPYSYGRTLPVSGPGVPCERQPNGQCDVGADCLVGIQTGKCDRNCNCIPTTRVLSRTIRSGAGVPCERQPNGQCDVGADCLVGIRTGKCDKKCNCILT